MSIRGIVLPPVPNGLPLGTDAGPRSSLAVDQRLLNVTLWEFWHYL